MGMPMGQHLQTPSPSIQGSSAPEPTSSPGSQAPVVDSNFNTTSGCAPQVQTVVSLQLEVDTTIGQVNFTQGVARALKDALAGSYSFCTFPRRKDLRFDALTLLIGNITVVEEDGKKSWCIGSKFCPHIHTCGFSCQVRAIPSRLWPLRVIMLGPTLQLLGEQRLM